MSLIKKRTSNRVWYILFVCAAVLALWVIALKSNTFEIRTVNIEGLNNVNESEARLLAGLSGAVNLLEFSGKKAERALLTLPFIKTAAVTKKYPHTVTITVEERRPCGYIDHRQTGSFILVDETGAAIDSSSYAHLKLPLIVGLNVETFTLGAPVGDGNSKGMEAAFEIARLLPVFELDASVTKIDVTNPDDAHVFIGFIDADFGAGRDLPRKVRDLKSVLDSGKVSEAARCKMDFTGEPGIVTYRYIK